MPKAEVGSIKHLSNQMKAKGLQRLRWFCDPCEKQCRDANAFKQHCLSESHNRKITLVGENPQQYIQERSKEFQQDFVSLLRMTHGEKFIGVNKFYNEYIRDKNHVHMNATKWSSLTQFAAHLGREGIVTVKESEDDKERLLIGWKDTSAAAFKRREEIRELELAEARSGTGGERELKRMAKRAQEEADAKAKILEARKAATGTPLAEEVENAGGENTEGPDVAKEAEAAPAAPVKISFGLKPKALPPAQTKKTESVFKRAARADREKENEEKPRKRLRL